VSKAGGIVILLGSAAQIRRISIFMRVVMPKDIEKDIECVQLLILRQLSTSAGVYNTFP
jgi:hypothetical protein